jgi:hypothetical protein
MSNPYESPISPPEFGPALAQPRRSREIWFRLAIAVGVLSLYVAANFPWKANQAPEDYALGGSLWFLRSPLIFAVVAKITLGKFETSFSRLAKQRTYRCFDAASMRRTQPIEKINGLLGFPTRRTASSPWS